MEKAIGHRNAEPFAIVVMGVAGSGKTAIGERLASRLEAIFIEGDTFHPPRNVALMSKGTPLTDDDREAWLDGIGNEIARRAASGRASVTSCSALKRMYRDRLRNLCPDIVFLFLEVDRKTAERRVARRRNHFMPASLVANQFDVLDPPGRDERAFTVDATQPVSTVVARSVDLLAAGSDPAPS